MSTAGWISFYDLGGNHVLIEAASVTAVELSDNSQIVIHSGGKNWTLVGTNAELIVEQIEKCRYEGEESRQLRMRSIDLVPVRPEALEETFR